jgi:predicted AlkP superfamily pyrophosphatase or phosphodiesterase
VALTTLQTGLPPQEHGIVGYRLFLKELGLIANLLRLKPVADPEGDRLLKMGLRPGAFLGTSTVHERLKRGDVRSFVMIDRRYAESGLSRMLSPKAASIVPFHGASDMAVQIRKLLKPPVERAFVFAYWDALDAIAHEYGPETEEWDAELKTLAFALEQGLFHDLEAPWLRDTLVLLLADHGQLRVLPKERVVHLKRYPSLVKRLRLSPTGEYRAAYLYAKPGALRDLEEGLRGRFAEELVVLRSEEALAAGLFGPPGGRVHPETRDRLGDLVVVPRGPQALYWPYDAFDLVGRHGGLTDEEMLVPLIAL